ALGTRSREMTDRSLLIGRTSVASGLRRRRVGRAARREAAAVLEHRRGRVAELLAVLRAIALDRHLETGRERLLRDAVFLQAERRSELEAPTRDVAGVVGHVDVEPAV